MTATHNPAICARVKGIQLRYSYKNWSDLFQCPDCGKSRRYSLNFLGRRMPTCDGTKIVAQIREPAE